MHETNLSQIFLVGLPPTAIPSTSTPRMTSHFPWTYTVGWFVFCVLWAARSLIVRKGRHYKKGKKLVDVNFRYKVVSVLVYLLQISLAPVMFWSNSKLLLKFHNRDDLRTIGIIACFAGLALSVSALIYLGRNYSPCYDSHEPFHLVTKGPYKWIRHPGWLAKFLVGFGGILTSGSWWFVPLIIWLYIEMKRTIKIEESLLAMTFPDYPAYQERTRFIIPFVF